MENCKPSTQGEYRRAIELFIKPTIGAFKTVDVERKDIAELHQKHRDKPYQANRSQLTVALAQIKALGEL